jgi:uncharacterized protein (TIGR00725 family)
LAARTVRDREVGGSNPLAPTNSHIKSLNNKTCIGVIGGRRVGKGLLKEAEEVGRLLAERGAVLVCGGLTGVMEHASKGAKSAGGTTVGILPHEKTGSENPYIDIPIATGMGIGRNVIITRTADAFIAVGGAYGTLSEIAFALQLGKPVVGIKSWDIKGIVPVINAAEAVNAVFEHLD